MPYVNSVGEQWRLQQLNKQLPLQDTDPKYCAQLNAAEAKELCLFERARQKKSIGKGVIRQLPYEPNQKIYCHQVRFLFKIII